MKLPRLSRRKFIIASLLAAPVAVWADARCLEPTWLKTRHVRLGGGPTKHRFVHFTDLHHKGDRAYLQTVVRQINALAPDFACFTGDLLEEAKYLAETLEILSGIMYRDRNIVTNPKINTLIVCVKVTIPPSSAACLGVPFAPTR